MCRKQQGMSPGLANTDNRYAGRIHGFQSSQIIDRFAQILDHFIVLQLYSDIAFLQSLFVARKAGKEIRRKAYIPRLGELQGKIFGVLDNAISLMEKDDSRPTRFGSGQGAKGSDAAAESDR